MVLNAKLNLKINTMKSLRNQIKQTFRVLVLCLSLVFFNSCQTSENDIVFSSEVLLTKDSKIVPLLLKAVGANTDGVSAKSTDDEQQCTQFVYPMTFYAYGSDAEEPYAVQINSDEELIAFLNALTAGNQFFITYPVTLLDVDGEETVINDYPDLEGILTMLVDACNSDDDDDGDGDGGDIDYEYCGNGNNPNAKVIICHKGQTICISINAIWGHMAHHSEDYYGSCNN